MLKRVPYKRCDKVPTLMAPGRNYVLRVRKPSQASARAVRLLGFVIRHEATQDEVDAQREDLGAVSCVPHHVENVAAAALPVILVANPLVVVWRPCTLGGAALATCPPRPVRVDGESVTVN